MTDLVLLLQAGSTLALTGLIWFVQVVHYPLFAAVGRDTFPGYEREHVRRTGWVVGPLLICEGLAATWLVASPPAGCGPTLPLLGFALLLFVWGSTATLQVPAHRRLASGFALEYHRRLTRTNWIRTILWTLRGLLALWMVRFLSVAPS